MNDTLDHVLDVSDDSADASNVLTGTKPDGDLEGLLGQELELDGDVLKVTDEGTTGAGNLDDARLDLDSHYKITLTLYFIWTGRFGTVLGDSNGLGGLDDFHLDWPGKVLP